MLKFFNRIKFILKFWKFIPFLMDYFKSNEVQFYRKVLVLLLILAYFVFPFDLIPDYLVLYGILDDVVIATFILERIVKMAPKGLKDKYNL